MSDFRECIKTKVLAEIADHRLILVTVKMDVPVTLPVKRDVWHFKSARWEDLQRAFQKVNWREALDWTSPETAADSFTEFSIIHKQAVHKVRPHAVS